MSVFSRAPPARHLTNSGITYIRGVDPCSGILRRPLPAAQAGVRRYAPRRSGSDRYYATARTGAPTVDEKGAAQTTS